jgi:hypothetical protein
VLSRLATVAAMNSVAAILAVILSAFISPPTLYWSRTRLLALAWAFMLLAGTR